MQLVSTKHLLYMCVYLGFFRKMTFCEERFLPLESQN